MARDREIKMASGGNALQKAVLRGGAFGAFSMRPARGSVVLSADEVVRIFDFEIDACP